MSKWGHTYRFEWVADDRRIGSSECPRDALKLRFLQAWAWAEEKPGRQVNVNGPGMGLRPVGFETFRILRERNIFPNGDSKSIRRHEHVE